MEEQNLTIEELKALKTSYKEQAKDLERRIDKIDLEIGRLEAQKKNWTPRKAVRAKCLDCCLNQTEEVRNCPATKCAIWPYRLPSAEGHVKLSVIRQMCLECSCGVKSEVEHCKILTCPLWQYRMGHNPKLEGKGGKGNADALIAWRESLKRAAAENNASENV